MGIMCNCLHTCEQEPCLDTPSSFVLPIDISSVILIKFPDHGHWWMLGEKVFQKSDDEKRLN